MILNGSGSSNMQNFESKRKLLFDCLDSAEKDLKGTKLDQSVQMSRSSSVEDFTTSDDDNHSPSKNKIFKFHGKESIFKKPALPIMKCLKPKIAPDYQVNPHKWKKYSLSDVDISDTTNTAAAFAFLKEIEIQKEQETAQLSINNKQDASKPVFNKSVSVKRNLQLFADEDGLENDKPKLKGSKLVMPEYTFGKKAHSKDKSRISSKSSPLSKKDCSQQKSAKQLRLAHLEENDDSDNDDHDTE